MMLGFVADTVIMFTTQLLFFIFGYLFFMLQLFSNYEVCQFPWVANNMVSSVIRRFEHFSVYNDMELCDLYHVKPGDLDRLVWPNGIGTTSTLRPNEQCLGRLYTNLLISTLLILRFIKEEYKCYLQWLLLCRWVCLNSLYLRYLVSWTSHLDSSIGNLTSTSLWYYWSLYCQCIWATSF